MRGTGAGSNLSTYVTSVPAPIIVTLVTPHAWTAPYPLICTSFSGLFINPLSGIQAATPRQVTYCSPRGSVRPVSLPASKVLLHYSTSDSFDALCARLLALSTYHGNLLRWLGNASPVGNLLRQIQGILRFKRLNNSTPDWNPVSRTSTVLKLSRKHLSFIAVTPRMVHFSTNEVTKSPAKDLLQVNALSLEAAFINFRSADSALIVKLSVKCVEKFRNAWIRAQQKPMRWCGSTERT